MRKLSTIILILVILCCFISTKAESVSFDEYMQKLGFVIYDIDSLERLGLESDTFDGEFANISIFGCVCGTDKFAFFGRHSDGKLFIAQNPYQSVLDGISPLLNVFSMVGIFVDICETYDFSIGLYIDSNGIHFGLSDDTPTLNAIADKIGSGNPSTRVVGWEDFRKLIMFH